MRADQLAFPRARATDPVTSHEAAAAIGPATHDLQTAVRRAAAILGTASQEEIAVLVGRLYPGRWLHQSVVSACNPLRSGLRPVGTKRNVRGRLVQTLIVP